MTSYTEAVVSGFNANPPSDGGQETDANKIEWQKHIDKIGTPINDAIEDTQTNMTTAVNAIDAALEGNLWGFDLSNNSTDATNDIDFAMGVCRDSTNTDTMETLATITKRLDASWAVGSGNGGLDTGAIADTWYHCFIIKRSDTGVVDALFSTSVSSPTLPSNYDYFRRVGSIYRTSSAIVPFWQRGDYFYWQTRVTEVTGSVTYYTQTALQVPPDIKVRPISSIYVTSLLGICNLYVADGEDSSGANKLNFMDSGAADGRDGQSGVLPIWTDTSQQIYLGCTETSSSVNFYTNGWVDERGKNFQ